MKVIFTFIKNSILIALCFTVQTALRADEAVYVTDDGDVSLGIITNNMYVLKPDKLEAASHLLESRPATNFPEGNWGAADSGYQLSLRFNKASYTNGEPIVATLLIRNVTNANIYLSYDLYPIGNSDGPIGFHVRSTDGELLAQHKVDLQVWNGAMKWLLPGTQVKHYERLDKRFDLTNGTYIVQAVKTARYLPWPEEAKTKRHDPIFKWSLQQEVEVKSAPVSLEIK